MAVTELHSDTRTYSIGPTGITAQLHYRCPWADRFTDSATLIGSAHPDNVAIGEVLLCRSVDISKLGDDSATSVVANLYADLVAHYDFEVQSAESNEITAINGIRWTASSNAITIGGKHSGKYTWTADNETIKNLNILPTQRIVEVQAWITGVAAAFTVATATPYIGFVNNAAWRGCATETALCDSFDVQEVYNANGTLVYKYTYSILYKPLHTWNEFYREDTGTWGEIDIGGNKVYTTANFTAL